MMASSHENAIDRAVAALRAADPSTQNDAVRALVDIGRPAVPQLTQLVSDPSADVRTHAMYALAQIREATAARTFKTGLGDSDERVRSYAATGLARIGHGDALSACLQTIDDNPDLLHTDLTPSVYALGDIGLKAVEPLLGLLTSPNTDTRMHAQRALELIVARRHGHRIGHGFPDKGAEAAAHAQWIDNGNYQFDGGVQQRKAAVAKWRQWLKTARDER